MKNIRLTVSYDGTGYAGWQRQNIVPSVQQVMEEAFHKLTGETVVFHAAGRTDAGVHALGQVCHIHTATAIPPDRLPLAMNTALPDDVRVLDAREVDMAYHARKSAVGKHYRYLWRISAIASPFWRNRAWQLPYILDAKAMNAAALTLQGTHDFYGFMASGSMIKETVRTIYAARVTIREDLLALDIVGNGFLYNMVRIIAGTLKQVGQGYRDTDLGPLLASRNRKIAGMTAPPEGLYLVTVFDEEEKLLEYIEKMDFQRIWD